MNELLIAETPNGERFTITSICNKIAYLQSQNNGKILSCKRGLIDLKKKTISENLVVSKYEKKFNEMMGFDDGLNLDFLDLEISSIKGVVSPGDLP